MRVKADVSLEAVHARRVEKHLPVLKLKKSGGSAVQIQCSVASGS